MSTDMMHSGCHSYKEWGVAMRKQLSWKPTDGQMRWWKSLTMPMSQRRAYYRGRYKRQAGNGKLRKEYRALTDQVGHKFQYHNNIIIKDQ